MKIATELFHRYEKKEIETELLSNFKESLQNPTFEKLVSKLKLSQTELSKYTTTLEDCTLDYANCLHC